MSGEKWATEAATFSLYYVAVVPIYPKYYAPLYQLEREVCVDIVLHGLSARSLVAPSVLARHNTTTPHNKSPPSAPPLIKSLGGFVGGSSESARIFSVHQRTPDPPRNSGSPEEKGRESKRLSL